MARRKPKASQCCVPDTDAINTALCQLEAMSPRLQTCNVQLLELTKCVARRCKSAKIPVVVWLEDEIAPGIQLGFDNQLHQGHVPMLRSDDNGVPRRHDAQIGGYRFSNKLPLHYAAAQIQVAAVPHLPELFAAVLDAAEALATSLDEAREFSCAPACCPFSRGCS